MVIFFAVAGNSYLVIRSLIVFLTMFKLMEVSQKVRKLLQSFFLAEVGLPNNSCVAFVGRFNNKVLASGLFSPVHSSHERLEILVLRLNLSLLIP